MQNNNFKFKILTILFFLLLGFFGLAGSSEAANWYVDNTATGSNNGSTWSSAWIDINYIKGLTAGDTVYIASGKYTGNYIFTSSGSIDKPITIKRATLEKHGSDIGWNNLFDGLVTINPSNGNIFSFTDKSYIVIDGVTRSDFVLYGQESARPDHGIYGGANNSNHHITIQNLTIHDMKYAGILIWYIDGAVEINNVEIYKNGLSVGHESDGNIVIVRSNANPTYGRSSIHHSYLHDPGYIQNNAATDIVTGTIKNFDIYNNHFNSGWCMESSSDMLHINGVNNYIYNNVFEKSKNGNNQNIFIHTNNPANEKPNNNYIYNNLFYSPSNDIGNGALSLMAYDGGSISNIYVYNNTFYGHRWNVYLNKSGSATYANIVFKNNIFWPNSVQFRHIMDNAAVFQSGQLILDNNFYYTSSASNKVLFSTIGNFSLSELQGKGFEVHGRNGDPFFSSTDDINGFYLTSESPYPLIGGGADLSNLFNYDKNGVSRGSAWDIGPYEYVSSDGDTTPPAAITNLSTSNPTSNSITLSWTSPGDDGNVGTATSYDIRYSNSNITDANWSSATQVTGEPIPLIAGTSQSMTVSGLLPNTTYYFAIKTRDEAPANWSDISNVLSATTSSVPPAPPGIIEAETGTLTSPMQIVSDVQASGGQYIQTTDYSESGTATYTFNISTTGVYKIIARVYAANDGEDSLYFKIDSQAEDTWDFNPSTNPDEFNVWREDELTKRGTGTVNNPQYDPYTLELTQGSHTITFRGREAYAKLDYFRFVQVSDTTPPAAPTGLTVN